MQNLHARYRDSLPCIGTHDMLFYVFKTYKVVPSLSTVVDCNSYFQRTKHHDKYLHEELEYRCIVSQEFVSTY